MSPAPAAPSVGEPEPPAPRFPRKRLLAIARACTGKATPSEWAMIYKSAASMVWPSVIGEAIAAFRASQAEYAALRSSLEEARKDSERLDWLLAEFAKDFGRITNDSNWYMCGGGPRTRADIDAERKGPSLHVCGDGECPCALYAKPSTEKPNDPS